MVSTTMKLRHVLTTRKNGWIQYVVDLFGVAVAHALQVDEFHLELLDGQAQRFDRELALRHILCQCDQYVYSLQQRIGTYRASLCHSICLSNRGVSPSTGTRIATA